MLQLYDGQYMYYLCCTGHDVGKSPYLRFLLAYYVPSAVLLFAKYLGMDTHSFHHYIQGLSQTKLETTKRIVKS
jgi:hypothetical protein